MKKILFVDPKNIFEECKLWLKTYLPLSSIETVNFFLPDINQFDLIISSEIPSVDIHQYPPLILIDQKILNTNTLLYNTADLIRYNPRELDINQINFLLEPPVMSGELSNHSVKEILNTIKTMPEKKRVRIYTATGRGCIFLENEDFIYSEYQDVVSYSGINAISFLLNLKEGYFDVREARCTPEFSNISGAVDIILNSMQYQPENLTSDHISANNTQSQLYDIKNIQNKIECITSVALFSEDGKLKEISDKNDEKILTDLNNIIFKELSKTSSILNLGRMNAFAVSTEQAFLGLSNKLFDRICLKGESRCDLMSNCSKLLEL